jgi:hypothetical protein
MGFLLGVLSGVAGFEKFELVLIGSGESDSVRSMVMGVWFD